MKNRFKGTKGTIILIVLVFLVVSYYYYLSNKTNPDKSEEDIKISSAQEIMLANLSAKRGDKTGTFNGKRSSKAYDYEVVLPMELLRRMAQGKNIKSYTIVGNKDRIKKLISGARGDLKISHGHSRMPKDIMAVKSVNPHENVVINGPSLKHV